MPERAPAAPNAMIVMLELYSSAPRVERGRSRPAQPARRENPGGLNELVTELEVRETPYLIIDPGVAERQFIRMTTAFGATTLYYAVKANPQPALIRRLARCGSSFDVASPAEIDLCLSEGVDPADLSYGNTVKKISDIQYAFARGVRLFVFDSEAELRKLAEHAPGSAVFCRLLASSEGAQWPLSRKFGCTPDMAVALLVEAAALGLRPIGVSFHVGSQQLDPSRWELSVKEAAEVFAVARDRGVRLTMLNVGGGFPISYRDPVPDIESYADTIRAAVDSHFPEAEHRPQLAAEPGRYLSADSGVLRAQVVLVSRKSFEEDDRWVYLDVGRFGGLAETEGEAIQYRLTTAYDDEPAGRVRLAGPTCDSVDILYEKAHYQLPLGLSAGDYVDINGAGAYTATYSSVGFNGFSPLSVICVGENS
jgi:ornithine decarboxylase